MITDSKTNFLYFADTLTTKYPDYIPQDPNDEHAFELLKHIQVEKKKYLEDQKQQKKKKSAKTLNHAKGAWKKTTTFF